MCKIDSCDNRKQCSKFLQKGEPNWTYNLHATYIDKDHEKLSVA